MWVLNVAHVFFLQETKFKEAIRYYEPTVKKHAAAILQVPAIVLANLCVAYIMTSQNEEAEELMRRVEREEERGDPDKQVRNWRAAVCTCTHTHAHTHTHAESRVRGGEGRPRHAGSRPTCPLIHLPAYRDTALPAH